MEEPQIHLLAAKGLVDKVLNSGLHGRGLQQHVRGLRGKPRSGATPAGQSAAQRLFAQTPSYKAAIEPLSRIDADVITFETCSSGAWTSRRSQGHQG